MYASIRREVPDFLHDYIVYCDTLQHYQQCKRRSCLILTKQLQFYEYQQKVLVNSIDLSGSCLRHIKDQLVNYTGLKGKWHDDTSATSNSASQPAALSFGKYIYRNLNVCKLYLIVRCFTQMLVLLRTPNDLQIAAEYAQVQGYKIVHGINMKYQALLEIHFVEANQVERTDFQNVVLSSQTEKLNATKSGVDELQILYERLRGIKSQLHAHQSSFQQEFAQQRDVLCFGNLMLRCPQLEQKQMLSRCGDIWLRLTAQQQLVLGVPLINNCSLGSCIVIRNIRALLGSAANCSYQQRLYQLQQQFEQLESIESFLQVTTTTAATLHNWLPIEQQQLQPESFGVLLIQLSITQLLQLQSTPLLLLYEVQKQLSLHGQTAAHTFELQLYLKKLNFPQIFAERAKYAISFATATLHQDFLAIAHTAIECCFCIEFIDAAHAQMFENLLQQNFDLKRLEQQADDATTRMHLDDNDDDDDVDDVNMSKLRKLAHVIYYNQLPASQWHGLLLLQQNMAAHKSRWKCYAKDNESMFLLIKLLLQDLLLQQINVQQMHLSTSNDSTLNAFEQALKAQLQAQLQSLNKKQPLSAKQFDLNNELCLRADQCLAALHDKQQFS